jgi:phospholipase A-2-activating protein
LESKQPVTDEDALGILVKMCTSWDYADRLAPLDLLRCAATSPLLASSSDLGSPIETAVRASLEGVPAGGQPNENCVMMGLRIIANLFASSEGRARVAEPSEATRSVEFLSRVLGQSGGEPIGKHNRNMLIALCTVAINYAALASNGGKIPTELLEKLWALAEYVVSTQKDSEVVFRALVALGTLATVRGKGQGPKSSISVVERAKDGASDPRVKNVADECLALLR